MKKYLLIIFTVLCAAVRAQDSVPADTLPAASRAASAQELWDRANTAYLNGAYSHAIADYDSIMAMGHTSYKLYYNLGNAYFKTNEIGRAMLYYNKALRLAPTDGDVKYNMAVAGSYVKDKIEQVPEFFFSRWVRGVRMGLSGYTWTWVSLGLLCCAVAAAMVYLLSVKLSRRKKGFFAAVVCLALFVVATAFAIAGRSEMRSPSEGIVMRTAVSVKSSPDRQSKDLFVIHEGTKVRVVGQLQEWREVVLEDGKKGWIEFSSIGMI